MTLNECDIMCLFPNKREEPLKVVQILLFRNILKTTTCLNCVSSQLEILREEPDSNYIYNFLLEIVSKHIGIQITPRPSGERHN